MGEHEIGFGLAPRAPPAPGPGGAVLVENTKYKTKYTTTHSCFENLSDLVQLGWLAG
jgi:hypothetical protein